MEPTAQVAEVERESVTRTLTRETRHWASPAEMVCTKISVARRWTWAAAEGEAVVAVAAIPTKPTVVAVVVVVVVPEDAAVEALSYLPVSA